MGDKSKIEWTDATWNPVTGCDRTSPGCDNCYALTMAKRLKAMRNPRYQIDGDPATSGPGFGLTLHEDLLDVPLRWTRPRRVFVNSMSDLFHPDVPDEFIVDVFAVMGNAPQHTFQVLTKRSKRMRDLLSSTEFVVALNERLPAWQRTLNPPWTRWADGHGRMWLGNVWLGVSIENDRYTFRADHLRDTPAAIRFVSAEPLLGALTSLALDSIDWVIVGGESGPGARPMHPHWVRELQERCESYCPADTDGDGDCAFCARGAVHPTGRPAFFFKQAGKILAAEWGMSDSKGHNLDEMPVDLQIRDWPR